MVHLPSLLQGLKRVSLRGPLGNAVSNQTCFRYESLRTLQSGLKGVVWGPRGAHHTQKHQGNVQG